MIFVLANISIKDGKKEEFLKTTENILKNTRLEDGCISYKLYLDCEEDNTYVMVEQWRSDEDLDKHMETSHFTKFVEDTTDLLAKDMEINKFDVN
ncbi:antibiotic biosynthesis monooxygenase [Methanobrevibacter sp. OttesenSCG-928-K11]|nr:antibiotic biosynthesis monooxygenase [Methanobrevibacter sp. OttesenSCG-928-K11]MDL2270615.1 antibiotic biosynthesis monooxygenase [Methanobrevibacter sp. OttesenSCG-928-I08]